MIQINVKNIGSNNKDKQGSGVTPLSSFILPLSGEKQVVQKIKIPDKTLLVFDMYQYCENCKTETNQSKIELEKGTHAYCMKCGHGYKIGL